MLSAEEIRQRFPRLTSFLSSQNLLVSGRLAVWAEEKNSDYESAVFMQNGELWRWRTARITPATPGAFVALWRRNSQGSTEPFDATDECAGVMIGVADDDGSGIFTFTNKDLERLGIYHSAAQAGKRGFRLYMPWNDGLNRQAQRTKEVQAQFFFPSGDG